MQTTFFFVRHGQVQNPDAVWYGRLPNFGLSEKGRFDITNAAEYLADKNIIGLLFSSPLQRAVESAEIIGRRLKLPVNISHELAEVKSSLQGKPFSYIQSINYDVFAGQGKDIEGETIQELYERMQNFVIETSQKNPGRQIAVVSHGDPIYLLRVWAEGLPVENSSLRPGHDKFIRRGEIYRVEYIFDKNKITCQSVFRPKK